jgi:hypothetical protein
LPDKAKRGVDGVIFGMRCNKLIFLTALFLTAVLVLSCDDVIRSDYRLSMPPPPEAWQTLLGEPDWRVEWFDGEGVLQDAFVERGGSLAVTLINDSVSPIAAYPYWPDEGIRPGEMKPAGALFPWDRSGGVISLSWRGGVDAVFWRAISAAENDHRPATDFDWKRWRTLWEDTGDGASAAFPKEIMDDPWLCDWDAIGAKTAQSGFDKRRVTAVKYSYRTIDTGEYDADWFGTSPFDAGVLVNTEHPLRLPLRPAVSLLFSERGIMRYSKEGFILKSFHRVSAE